MITLRKTPEVIAVSGTTAFDSTDLSSGDKYAVHIEIGGSLSGTLKIQGKAKNASQWVDIDDSDQAVVAGDTALYNLRDLAFDMVRPYFSHSSGTGNITIHRSVKGP